MWDDPFKVALPLFSSGAMESCKDLWKDLGWGCSGRVVGGRCGEPVGWCKIYAVAALVTRSGPRVTLLYPLSWNTHQHSFSPILGSLTKEMVKLSSTFVFTFHQNEAHKKRSVGGPKYSAQLEAPKACTRHILHPGRQAYMPPPSPAL